MLIWERPAPAGSNVCGTRDIALTGIEIAVMFLRTRASDLGRVILLVLLVALSACTRPATVLRVAAPTRAPRPLVRHDVAPIPLSPPQDEEPVAAPTADGESAAASGAYEYPELNKLLDVDWPGDDIRNVASDITFDTGVTVQVGPLVVGTVTLTGDAMPVGLILDLISTPNGATYVRQADNVYLIAAVNTKSPAFPTIADTKVVDLEYVKVSQLRDMLPDYLLEYVRLSSDEPHALVTAPPKLMAAIIRIIRDVDRPQKQLVLRALVVELSEEAARELGFEWAIDSSRTAVPEGGRIPSNRLDAFDASQDLQGGVFTHDFGATLLGEFTHQLRSSLRSLVQNGKAQIRVDTRLMTQNGKPADLNFRLQQFFRIETGTVAFPRIDLEKIESGVKLQATPQISRSGSITLDLSTTVDDVVALSSNGLPVVQTRNANSTVRVQDGDTIVIAGMVEERESEIEQRVPLFGYIPIVGRFFSSTRKMVSKREVAIFITPEILPDSGSTWEWDFALAE